MSILTQEIPVMLETLPTISPLPRRSTEYDLSAILAMWLEMGSRDLIIKQNGQPVAVLIPYRDFVLLQQAEILDDMRDGREATAILEEINQDPARVRPYQEFRAELVTAGLLDE